MNASHVTGAGIGTALGAVLVAALRRWAGVDLSGSEDALVGSALLAAGTGVGHALVHGGVVGLARVFWCGQGSGA